MIAAEREQPIDWAPFCEQWFTPAASTNWRIWCDAKPREHNDLIALLRDGKTQMPYRAHALLLLLTLDEAATPIPVYCKLRFERDRRFHGHLALEELPQELVPFALALILHAARTLAQQEEMPRTSDWQRDVNLYILQAIALYPTAPETELLWPHFDLNDANCFSGIDSQSGYRPFEWLMLSDKVDRSWKLRADARMRERVRHEQCGKLQPRVDWEDAYFCYAGQIAYHCIGTGIKLPYDFDIVVDQIEFLLTQPRAILEPVFSTWQLGDALHLLRKEKFRSLRLRIIENAVFNVRKPFRVESEGDVVKALALRDHFPADHYAYRTLMQRIAEAQPRIAESKERHRAYQEQQARVAAADSLLR